MFLYVFAYKTDIGRGGIYQSPPFYFYCILCFRLEKNQYFGVRVLTNCILFDISESEKNYCSISVGFLYMGRISTPYLKYKPKELKDLSWRIIIEAWENGASDREVSLRLSKDGKADQLTSREVRAIYKDSPALADLKEMLFMENTMSARETVSQSIKGGDIQTAKWWLERKTDEFSSKSAVALENAVIELTVDDKEKALKQMIENFESKDGK